MMPVKLEMQQLYNIFKYLLYRRNFRWNNAVKDALDATFEAQKEF